MIVVRQKLLFCMGLHTRFYLCEKGTAALSINIFYLRPLLLPLLLKKRATCDRGHATLARDLGRKLRVDHRASAASKRL